MSDEAQNLMLPLDVPPRPGGEWQQHTAERWRDPHSKHGDVPSYEYAIYLIKELCITGVSDLKELIDQHRAARGKEGISRQTVAALKMDRSVFAEGEMREISKRAAEQLTAECLAKARNLIDKSKSTKDIGAVAMMLTAGNNVNQLLSGGPTEIKEHRHRFSIEDFEEARRKRLTNDGVNRLPEAIDVPMDVVAECVRVAEGES